MDEIDARLLEILTIDSSQTATEIASQIKLSIPATIKRIGKLTNNGIIERFTIQANAKRIGKSVLAYIAVTLNPRFSIGEFQTMVHADRDIVECSAVSGEYDYLLKIYASDVKALDEKLNCFKRKQVISKSQTMFSLSELKHLPGPLPD